MLRRTAPLISAVAVLFALAGNEARAAFGNFTYTTGVAATTGGAPPAAPAIGAGPVVVNIGGGNTLTFSGNNSAIPIDGTLTSGADINFGDITYTPSGTNDGVFAYTVSYNYTVAVTDVMGGDVHNFNFTGSITGNVNGEPPAAINGNVFNFAVSPTSQVYNLGTYDATNKGGTGPGSSGGVLTDGTLQGNISAASVPEPASVFLVGVGGLGLLAVARRRSTRA
jgi:hypothetical protein